MNIIQSFGFIILILFSPIVVDTFNQFGTRGPEHALNLIVISIGSALVLFGAYYDQHK